MRGHFLRFPAAFGQDMRIIARVYLERCEEAGAALEEELLLPIAEVFARLQRPEGG